MKTSFSVVTLSAGILLAVSTSSHAAFIDFNTQQNGTPYVGLEDSFGVNEYDGVDIYDGDSTRGATYVHETNPLNVGTAINGYYAYSYGNEAMEDQYIVFAFTSMVSNVSFDFASPNGLLIISARDSGGISLGVFNYNLTGSFISQDGSIMNAGHVDLSGIGNIGFLLIEPVIHESLIFDNLSFQPVPVPAALPLLLSGLLGLGLIKRRVA